jgi:hypothetical protein
MKYFLSSILICFIISSCKKPEDRTCWKTAGAIKDTVLFVNDFSKLVLDEKICYELIQDSLNKIEIIGGKNLITKIQVQQNSDGLIEIKNLNKCDFLRYNSEVVKVRIHVKNLTSLEYRGTETLTSTDTLRFSNFEFFMKSGAGSIRLKLNISNNLLGFITGGPSDFQLSGIAKNANFSVATQGSCDTRNLVVQNLLSIVSNANAPCYVNALGTNFKSEITGQGNIYYLGTPLSITSHLYGAGQLIKL